MSGVPSLRGNADEVNGSLHEELQAHLEVAGLAILEARLTHLAYAPAVGLVDMALREMGEQDGVELD